MHAHGIAPMPHMMPPHQLVHSGHMDPLMQHPGFVSGTHHLQADHPAAPMREPWGYHSHQGMMHPGPDPMRLPPLLPPPHARHGRF